MESSNTKEWKGRNFDMKDVSDTIKELHCRLRHLIERKQVAAKSSTSCRNLDRKDASSRKAQ